jgi:peptide methionine sulfoxide reductase MsrB
MTDIDDDGSCCPKCAEPTGIDAEEFWEENGSQGVFVCPHCKARLVAGWDDYESPDGWWAFELAKDGK